MDIVPDEPALSLSDRTDRAAVWTIEICESLAFIAVSRFQARPMASAHLLARLSERDAGLADNMTLLAPAMLDLYNAVATVHLMGEPDRQRRDDLLQRLVRHLVDLAEAEFGEPLGCNPHVTALADRLKTLPPPTALFDRSLVAAGGGFALDVLLRHET